MKRYCGLLLSVLIALAGLAILFCLPASRHQPAQAAIYAPDASIVVNTSEDELNSDGDCSLREAVTAANTNAAVDACPAGGTQTDTITFSVAGTITVTSQLSVTAGGPLVIDGGEVITTSGGGMTRVWWVETDSDLILQNLTVVDGYLPQDNGAGLANNNGNVTMLNCSLVGNQSDGSLLGGRGGAIYNTGSMTIDSSTFAGNHADAGRGGGIYNTGYLTLTNSTLSGNSVYYYGGAIYNWGFLALSNCTLSDNSAGSIGGGIYNYFASLTIIDHSTLSGNYARFGGAIYVNLGTLTVTHTTFSGNGAGYWGGGIVNYGSSMITDSTIIENYTGSGSDTGGKGGGIDNRGTLVISNSTILSNTAYADVNGPGQGGGISNGGILTITQSTLYDNISDRGGGILNGWLGITGTCAYSGTMVIENSTLVENSGAATGGGITNICNSSATIANSTLSGNESASGGGIHHDTGDVQVINTIIANSPTGDDCAGTILDGGHNLDSDGTCNLDPVNGSLPNTDPLLGPLQDNGGPTWTQALLAGSPAVDTGDNAQCPVTDQRGMPRPFDGDKDGEAVCDLGAYEFQHGISLIPPVQFGAALPGKIVGYTISLGNWSPLIDTYNLALSPHAWETNLSSYQIGPLGPGGIVSFTLSVTVPPEAGWYQTDNVMITATSQTSPTEYTASAQVTTQAEVPVTPTAVTINGPEAGWVGESQVFTAVVEPISTSLPVTYTWQATGQDPAVHTGGITDTVAFTWQFPGTQVITVTATNDYGTVMDTHAILINEVPISGLSASNDSPTVLVNPTTFTATVTAGTNVSFAWDFGDDSIGSGAGVTHTYSAIGVYTATVSANNSASVITATTQVTILAPSYPLYLPNILKEQQVGGLIEAVITTQGYAIHYPTDYFTYGYVCNLTTEPLYDVIIQFEVTWHSYNDPTGHIEIFKVTPALTATLPG